MSIQYLKSTFTGFLVAGLFFTTNAQKQTKGSSLFTLPNAVFTPTQTEAAVKSAVHEGGGNSRGVSMMGQQAATNFGGEYGLVKNEVLHRRALFECENVKG